MNNNKEAMEKLAVRFVKKIKIKRLTPESVIPKKANSEDAGYDIVAIDDGTLSDDGTYIQYKTGIAIEPPYGYHTELFPRSSISKYDLVLANSIGLVDFGYRNELLCRFKIVLPYLKNRQPILYKKGDKICQLVIRQTVDMEIEEVSELGSSERNMNGFGSSGK